MNACLPEPTILATGAWLKNRACLLRGTQVQWSPLHGDLGTPEACDALAASVQAWLAHAHEQDGPRPQARIAAVAHDLHPDFFSTQLAVQLAQAHGLAHIAVQHHHAHIAAVVAEHDVQEPVVGLALDGVGLGSDGLAWGGELLWVHHHQWQRLGHLALLPLPGGDRAAREPWRMAAAVLHALGRGGEIVPRFGAAVGTPLAQGVADMLAKDLRSPRTSSAGRWFDAAAAALGLVLRQDDEAQAPIALEQAAAHWLAQHGASSEAATDPTLAAQMLAQPPSNGMAAAAAGDNPPAAAHDGAAPPANTVLNPLPLLATLWDAPDPAAAAARFHATLAEALCLWAAHAAQAHGTRTVCLGGGCFFNRILTGHIERGLGARGLRVLRPLHNSCGDAGLALGQAWVAAHCLTTD